MTMAEAAESLPGQPNSATLWRWRTYGARGVKLETILIGGRRYTSREALERFIERTTAAADGISCPARTHRQREKAIAAAERELEALGISGNKKELAGLEFQGGSDTSEPIRSIRYGNYNTSTQ
ncbi:MAG: DUF1580 domain-containing protein [Pirellulales bacterium]|nr:DUF1580 domain-containing protein [Pirellulales bacterium]